MKKIMMSLLTIALVGAVITGGVIALFSDVEEVGQNVFTAGTLDLEVSENSPIPFTIANMKPGDIKGFALKLKNVGSIAGVIKVKFGPITNYENGRNGPEIAAGDTSGNLDGELGKYLVVKALKMNTPLSNGVTMLIPFYDWTPRYKVALNTYAGTTHWLQERQSGPGIPAGSDILGPQEEATFFLIVELPSGVGNIVQSDSVEFDLIFTLDQVQ